MFLNNLRIAYRNLLKNKLVSFINILGLTLGLASALLAVTFAKHELTYENHIVIADSNTHPALQFHYSAIKFLELRLINLLDRRNHFLMSF